jgi:hypothetical protein
VSSLPIGTNQDAELETALVEIERRAEPDVEATFGSAIRQAIDEVLDGPRTGRWRFDQLEKTEKTYVGTRLEILLRTSLELGNGNRLDLDVDGIDVDVKWSMDSRWCIPKEAVGELCLCVGGLSNLSRFQVGLIRCSEDCLTAKGNQDQKRAIRSGRRASMRMLVSDAPLPSNFLVDMDPDLLTEVMGEPSIQKRVTRLFRELPYEPIPRGAIQTVAQTTGDPMRRIRADKAARDALGGMRILSSSYSNKAVEALGRKPLAPREFMSIPENDLTAMPAVAKEALPPKLRERLGLA